MLKLKLHPFIIRNKIVFLSLTTILISIATVGFINSSQQAAIYLTQTADCSSIIDPEEKMFCQKQNKTYSQQAPNVQNQFSAPSTAPAGRSERGNNDLEEDDLLTGFVLPKKNGPAKT